MSNESIEDEMRHAAQSTLSDDDWIIEQISTVELTKEEIETPLNRRHGERRIIDLPANGNYNEQRKGERRVTA